MKLNFMVPGLPISTKTVKEMYNEDGEAIDRAPNPMMLLTMEVTQPVAVGDMIRKKNKPAKGGVNMSVRVNDLLKLPSLREATVLSGKTNWTHLLLLFLFRSL